MTFSPPLLFKGLCHAAPLGYDCAMTNALALWIVALIIGFFVLDAVFLHLGAPVFLARKGLDLLDYLAFWR